AACGSADRLQYHPSGGGGASADPGDHAAELESLQRRLRVGSSCAGFVDEEYGARAEFVLGHVGECDLGGVAAAVFLIPAGVDGGVFEFHSVGDLQAAVGGGVLFEPFLYDFVDPVRDPSLVRVL